ncbi:MAG: hypothetical protein C0609_02195 [Deltaproteobacteria bacterium]|nr:MAG: hypothetical protein C0609_02195 [Deltaproteobacteria bacterium]
MVDPSEEPYSKVFTDKIVPEGCKHKCSFCHGGDDTTSNAGDAHLLMAPLDTAKRCNACHPAKSISDVTVIHTTFRRYKALEFENSAPCTP